MAGEKNTATGRIRDVGTRRRNILSLVLGRLRRLIRNPVVLWFAGVVFIVLMVVVLMILLLNIGVLGVDDLLADIPLDTTGIVIIGHIYHLDLGTRQLSISWILGGCGNHTLPSFPGHYGRSFTSCTPPDRPVDVYFDRNPEPVFSYDPAMLPVNRSTQQSFYVASLLEFTQDHQLVVYAGSIYIAPPVDARHWFDQPLLAPYDDYALDARAFVIDTATNQSLPILELSAADPTDNFFAYNQYDWDTESTFNGARVASKHLMMRIKRNFLSKFFTIILLVVNWLLTAGCLRITLVSLVRHEELGEGVLLLPITVILTIPALRQLYVGSPPFGILLDVLGFFLQIIIVSLCSLLLLVRIARGRGAASKRRRWTTPEGQGLFRNAVISEEEEVA